MHTVVVDGEVVIRDGRSTRVDEAALRARLVDVMPQFDRDYAVARERVARLREHIDSASHRVADTDLGIDRMLTSP